MKRKILISIILVLLVFSACDKKLRLHAIENDKILLEQYEISTITTVHQYCDITNKRWNKTERIFEANQGDITSVEIKNDSIILETDLQNNVIYDLAAIKFGYKIILKDSNKSYR